jgi:hypothetical protein
MQRLSIICLTSLVFFVFGSVSAQTTEFTYQGNLKDGGVAANGNYDFEFALFDAVSGGNQIGSTLTRNSVIVTNGIFSVALDFGSQFPGANRFLEIRVRLSGQPGITTLAPRQPVEAAPYSVKALSAGDAATLGSLPVGQFVQTNDPRLSDARPPTAGSSNYIQNTSSPQTSSNFNISGNGTAGGTLSGNVVNASTQYNIGGVREFSVVVGNIFVGLDAGHVNTGSDNSFFGAFAGQANTTGDSNSFYGHSTGELNTTGYANSFFGTLVGVNNTMGQYNSFFGEQSGYLNTTGAENAFFGVAAGNTNTIGDHNTIIGYNADVGSNNLSFATALGANAVVSSSNTIVLGRADGSDTVDVPGKLQIDTLGVAGSTALCLNSSSRIGTCSSSLRYKTNVARFSQGLTFVNRLRPISFDWKDGGMKDVGFAAEDIEKIDPRFVTFNKKGEVEGVKYDRLSVAFVNAFKEQQAQIEKQQSLIDKQQVMIEQLQKRLDQLEKDKKK